MFFIQENICCIRKYTVGIFRNISSKFVYWITHCFQYSLTFTSILEISIRDIELRISMSKHHYVAMGTNDVCVNLFSPNACFHNTFPQLINLHKNLNISLGNHVCNLNTRNLHIYDAYYGLVWFTNLFSERTCHTFDISLGHITVMISSYLLANCGTT